MTLAPERSATLQGATINACLRHDAGLVDALDDADDP
jgi:hypothetical protein